MDAYELLHDVYDKGEDCVGCTYAHEVLEYEREEGMTTRTLAYRECGVIETEAPPISCPVVDEHTRELAADSRMSALLAQIESHPIEITTRREERRARTYLFSHPGAFRLIPPKFGGYFRVVSARMLCGG